MNYPEITLPKLLEDTASAHSDQTAIIFLEARFTYQTLRHHVDRAAAGLQRLGIRPGDRVGLFLQNCPQFVVSFFAVLKAGGILTPTSPIYTPREAEHQWKNAGVTLLIADRSLSKVVDAARHGDTEIRTVVYVDPMDYSAAGWPAFESELNAPPATAPTANSNSLRWIDLLKGNSSFQPVTTSVQDVACLQYTGGTTGISKGAMLTHYNLVTNAIQACERMTIGPGTADSMVVALPLFHIYAMTCVMITGIRCAFTLIILPRFELQSVLDVIRRYRPTYYHGVPTMYVAFNNTPQVRDYGFHSLKVCMSGGAPLPVEVRERFETLTGGRLLEGYGLTEASPVTHIGPIDRAAPLGSMGTLVQDTEAKIVDPDDESRELGFGEAGELLIRGPQVMKGYWNQPEETARVLRNGWLHTGDIAKRDAEGFYYIVDRKKDLIIAGGYNVYPREVEEVLFSHPSVQEAVAIGIPHAYRGETVKAYVVLKQGCVATAEEIIAYCRECLSAYKVPQFVEFRNTLPKTGVGKYLRRELRAEAISALPGGSVESSGR